MNTESAGDTEGLDQDALADLSLEERARRGIKLRAAGETDRLEALREATPAKTHDVADPAFHRHEGQLRAEALYALWELDTGAWSFLYELKDARLREYEFIDFPEAEWTEEPTEENGYLERRSLMAAVSLLAHYRGWERFVTEDIGVTLAQFLAHPIDPDAADEYVARIEHTVEIAEKRLFGFDDVPEVAADDLFEWASAEAVEGLVDEKYAKITAGRAGEFE